MTSKIAKENLYIYAILDQYADNIINEKEAIKEIRNILGCDEIGTV